MQQPDRLIVYGDIHGCCDEFTQLRSKIKPLKKDLEVCVGDLITRGKDSIKTLRYIQKNGIKSIVGNHEDKIIRYIKHNYSKEVNPVVLNEDENDIVSKLNTGDIYFLKNMPIFMKFGGVTVLHGGLQNHFNLNTLSKRKI